MSSPSTETRELLIGDYAAVLALWAQVEGLDICEGDAEQDLSRYLKRNSGMSRVALADGKIIGAAMCGHDGRRGYIYHLAVAPAHRGLGIAKRLVEECVKGLRAAGIPRVIILVEKTNASGRLFWERNGWETIDGALPMTRET